MKILFRFIAIVSIIISLTSCKTATDKQLADNQNVHEAETLISEDVEEAEEVVEVEYDVKYVIETEHFEIKFYSLDFNEEHQLSIEKIAYSLENDYKGLAEKYKTTVDGVVKVEIHNDHDKLHIAMGYPGAPDWACGGYAGGKVLAAAPLLPTPGIDYEGLINVPIHEYTHLLLRKINYAVPRWLNEGIAFYEAKEHSKEWVETTIQDGIVKNEIPSLEYFDTGNDFQEFAVRQGYQYMYTFVEYIVWTYGYEKLNALIADPDGFENIFGLTKDEIESNWIEYITIHYSL